MGRTSKFLFPIPSRKDQINKNSSRVPDTPPHFVGQGLTKAERILGTSGSLNIDNSSRDEEQIWRNIKPKSSGMSISLSESTEDTDCDEEEESRERAWDAESGVLGVSRLRGQPSSTALGEHDGLTDTSSLSRRLRNNGSSSTLGSHYDRQKNPLSISQQTSSSSARDLALRKGLTKITGPQRSPLFNVDCADELDESHTIDANTSPKSARKKPGRLDLSKLFPKPRQDTTIPNLLGPDSLTQSPAAMSFVSTRSNGYFSRPGRSGTPVNRYPRDEGEHVIIEKLKAKSQFSVHSLQERYANRRRGPQPELPLGAIPERSSSRNVYGTLPEKGYENLTGPQLIALHTPPPSLDSSMSPVSKRSQFSWKHVRGSVGGGSSTWDSGSMMSTSSMNTRNSKKTNGSVLESSDLKISSVLSLSSDEDSDASGDDRSNERSNSQTSRQSNRTVSPVEPLKPPAIVEKERPSPPTTRVARPHMQRIDTRKIPKSRFRDSQFLPLPMPSPINSRISGPWGSSSSHTPDSSSLPPMEEPKMMQMQIPAIQIHQGKMDTPPLSPSSIEFQMTPGRSSRFMAVNTQERALLEALRQKRNQMLEQGIIASEGSAFKSEDKVERHTPNSKKKMGTSSSPYRTQPTLGAREPKQSDGSSGSGRQSRTSVISRSTTDSSSTVRAGSGGHQRSESGSSGFGIGKGQGQSHMQHNDSHHGYYGGPQNQGRTKPLPVPKFQGVGMAIFEHLPEHQNHSQSQRRPRSQSIPQHQDRDETKNHHQPHPPPLPQNEYHPPPLPQNKYNPPPLPQIHTHLQSRTFTHHKRTPSTSTAFSSSTALSKASGNILVLLERSNSDPRGIQTAEPSPDLSEFYRESFGLGAGYRYYSDEEDNDNNRDGRGKERRRVVRRSRSGGRGLYGGGGRKGDYFDVRGGSERAMPLGGGSTSQLQNQEHQQQHQHQRDLSTASTITAAPPPQVKLAANQRSHPSQMNVGLVGNRNVENNEMRNGRGVNGVPKEDEEDEEEIWGL